MIGKRISHYQIIAELGSGGMGVVYKARDTKLGRDVALKFLPAHLNRDGTDRARFLQEARAAAALNHPNVCTIYEIHDEGENPFIAMEFVEGKTLRRFVETQGPVPLETAVPIAMQIAAALQAAHDKGIIHRDIKSENIMVTESGLVKVMDFGLARMRGAARITKTGATIGTVAYMSPEQARGEELDPRSDIWSLGVVLVEMLTGELPFRGEYDQAVIYSLLHEKPEIPSGIPAGLNAVLIQCLQKNPSDRFQNAGDIMAQLNEMNALEGRSAKGAPFPIKTVVSGAVFLILVFLAGYFLLILPGSRKAAEGGASGSHTIAVLPFVDMSPEKDEEYFCDGMAEELINTLTKVPDFQVTARTSAFSFKGKKFDIPTIGKKLNVDLVVEGSVRKAGDNLRITAQLIKVRDGYHLWSESYNRRLKDVFAIQEEISRAIMEELKINLLAAERAGFHKRNTNNIEAYTRYLQGRYFWNKRTEAGFRKSLEYFQQAIDRDPQYALAYVGKADAYNLLAYWGYMAPREAYSKAKALVEHALRIDDSLAEAYASLGWILLDYDWNWSATETSLKKALELNPNYALTYHWYGAYLESQGQLMPSLEMRKKALALDPLSLQINSQIGYTLFIMGRLDEAEQYLRKPLEMDPNCSFAHMNLGHLYAAKGQLDRALAEYQKARSIPWVAAFTGSVLAKKGEAGKARELIARLKEQSKKKYVRPSVISVIEFALKDNEKAFDWLEKGFAERDPVMPWVRYVVPDRDGLHSHPRFQSLLKKLHLD